MKFAIPVSEQNGMASAVFGHFGSAPFYAVYDEATASLSFIDNGNRVHEHGTCRPTGELKEKGVEAVVCGGMGARAIGNLNDLGIKVYFCADAASVSGILAMVQNEELREMRLENACNGHHGCH